jgi:nitrogen-specific signal transduction histidine kinase
LKFMHGRFPPPDAAEVKKQQLQRAAIMGQLAGGVLHDFNNILTVITGTIEILAAAVADRADLAAIASLIDEAATRGAQLTSQLLTFARGQPLGPCEFDVNAVIAEVSRLLRSAFRGRIEISLAVAHDLPQAVADPGLLTAAILSLAIPARDEMPDGGTLGFRTRLVRAGQTSASDAAACRDFVAIMMHARALGFAGDYSHGILPETDMVEDLVSGAGGCIIINRSTDGSEVEILLPTA